MFKIFSIAIMCWVGLVIPAVSATCDEADLAIVTTPAPTLFADEWRRQKRHRSLPTADVLVIGDSLAQSWPTEWAEVAFQGQTVANLGVRSDRIQNVLWRIDDIQHAQPNPRIILLWIGTNNLLTGDKDCALAEGVVTLVSAVRQRWASAKLLVAGIAPHGVGYREEARVAANQIIRTNQLPMGFRYIGLDGLACSEGDRLLDEYAHCAYYRPDNVHLEIPGYAVVSYAIRSVLR